MSWKDVLVSVVLFAGGVCAESPAVIWWSDPVEPGEAVQLFGGAWGDDPVVEFEGETIRPLKKTETSLWFDFPATYTKGVATCRVRSSNGVSAPFLLNGINVQWFQCDRGPDATPGGWIRFFGRCLQRGKPQVWLRGEDGTRHSLSLTQCDEWSLDAVLPADLPLGSYQAEVFSGAGKRVMAGTLRVVAKKEVWKETLFRVTDFGAIPNDGMDDTSALQAALHAAETNGGGIVWLPRGRFQCNDTLVIPPYTLLRGENRDLSCLYWPDTDTPPKDLFRASHSFGIEELFIHSGHYQNGLTLDNELGSKHELTSSRTMLSHDITIRHCIFKFIVDQYLLRDMEKMGRRLLTRGNGLNIRDARFVRIEDCDIYCSKEGSSTLFFIVTGQYVTMKGCRINGSGWAVVGGDHVIYEKNDAWNCTYSVSSVTRNLFWSKNRQFDLFTNNRESVTHDGAKTAFTNRKKPRAPGFAVPATCVGRVAKLDFSALGGVMYNGKPEQWIGYELQIVDGRGVGQSRRIVSIREKGTELTLDRPFEILPDVTSRFVVAAERKNLIYVDNDIEDSTIAIQLYGGATDCVLARNRCRRTGGFIGSGRNYHGLIPCWFVQFLDNVIESGNSYRGPQNNKSPRDAAIGSYHACDEYSLTRAYVFRRNRLCSNAHLQLDVQDALAERNVIAETDYGMDARRFHKTLLIRNNQFTNVVRSYSQELLVKGDFHPAEALLSLVGSWKKRGPAITALQKEWDALRMLPRNEPQVLSAQTNALSHLFQAMIRDRVSVSDRDLLKHFGIVVKPVDWTTGPRNVYWTTNAISKLNIPMEFTQFSPSPGATLSVSCDAVPDGAWTFDSVTVPLGLEQKTKFSLPAHVKAGRRSFFTLPLTVTLSLPGCGTVTWKTNPQLLTQNRILQWVYAPGLNPDGKAEWRIFQKYSPHEECDYRDEVKSVKNGDSFTAVTYLRVKRPCRFSFGLQGNATTALVNGKEFVLNGGLRPLWEPGLYRFTVTKKITPRANTLFKLFMSPFPDPFDEGSIEILSAEEALQLEKQRK